MAAEAKDIPEPGRRSGESKVAFAEVVEEREHPAEFTNHAEVHCNEFGDVLDVNEYHIDDQLGSGSFATVYLCTRESDGGKYAVKVFDKSRLRKQRTFTKGGGFTSAMDKVAEEVAIMKKLEHPNLVSLHEVIDDEKSNQLFLVLDYVEYGVLLDWDSDERLFNAPHGDVPFEHGRKVFSEERAAMFATDILRGLKYLHLHHIAHRDLKPENILLTSDGHCKIADFGVAHHFKEEETKETRSMRDLSRSVSRGQTAPNEGTYYFYAPEMCVGNTKAVNAYCADLWAAGVVVYCMLFGKLPFWGNDASSLFDAIAKEELVMPSRISPDGESFIRGLMQRRPLERLDLTDGLNHTWLQLAKHERPSLTHGGSMIHPPTREEIANAFRPMKNFLIRSKSGIMQPLRKHLSRKSFQESRGERANSDSSERPPGGSFDSGMHGHHKCAVM